MSDPPTVIYLVVEGKPDQDFVYLIGMIIVHAGQEERFSFWADNQDEEVKIVQQMLDEMAHHENFTVFSYGSYERDFLRPVRKAARKKKPLDRVLDSLVNVLSLVHTHAYFPTYGNGLKEVAACLGFSWSALDASGLQSIVWRGRWEATHDDLWKEKLTQYNLEDCAAMLRGFQTGALAAAGTIPAGDGGLPVSEVKELDKWDNIASGERPASCNPNSSRSIAARISTTKGSACMCGATRCGGRALERSRNAAG